MVRSDGHIVYWARLSASVDIYNEGYVGISSNSLQERKKSHYKAARSSKSENLHFHNALNKYGDEVVWSVIHSGLSSDEAFELEAKYRPKINIGWNSDKGGVSAISSEWYENEDNREKHKQRTSEATKLKIAEKDTPEARSQRARNVWKNSEYRESRKGEIAGEKNPNYGKYGLEHPAAGHVKTKAGRKSISEANRARVVSKETREKISKTRIAMFAEQKKARLAREAEDRERKRLKREQDRLAGAFRGEKARSSKISNQQRVEICKRRAAGETYNEISKDYPLTLTGVRAVCQTWGPENGYSFENIIGKPKLKK